MRELRHELAVPEAALAHRSAAWGAEAHCANERPPERLRHYALQRPGKLQGAYALLQRPDRTCAWASVRADASAVPCADAARAALTAAGAIATHARRGHDDLPLARSSLHQRPAAIPATAGGCLRARAAADLSDAEPGASAGRARMRRATSAGA